MTGHTRALKAKRATFQGRPFVYTLTGRSVREALSPSRWTDVAKATLYQQAPTGSSANTCPKAQIPSVCPAEDLERIGEKPQQPPTQDAWF